MNSKLLYFVGGVVAGSVATFLVLRKRMNKQIEDEVASVKDTYEKRGKIIERVPVDTIPKVSQKDISDRNSQLKEDILKSINISDVNGYGSMASGRDPNQKTAYNLFSNPPRAIDIHNGIDEGEDLEVYAADDHPSEGISEEPYTIEPEDFINEKPFFDKITLEYYEDDVLSDALSEDIYTDIEGTIGRESLNKFGEYEEDVVYVRNERLSTDYEVILQHKPFANIPEDSG